MRIETLAEGIDLYCGDCRAVLPTLGKVDAVVTDPPYGIASIWQGGNCQGWKFAREDKNRNVWDAVAPSTEFMWSIVKDVPSIVWGGNSFSLPPSRCWLVWDKKQPGFSTGDCELAWTNFDRPVRVFVEGRNVFTPVHSNPEVKEHTSQKPLNLMKWCLGFLQDAQSILDPFMGSGTTGVAAVKLGRKFIGIEIEPKYFDIACRRIEQALRQPDLFIEQPKPAKQEVLL